MNDAMHRKSVELSSASGEDSWLSGLAEARPVALCRVRMWFGADGKVSIERMCISLLMSKNLLNSKVIIIPELRSRKCFLCFYVRSTYTHHGYGTS